MAVLTNDILLQGVRRDDAFDWLSEPANHARILQGAFSKFSKKSDTEFELKINQKPRARTMGYIFLGPDSSHRGRRIQIQLTGKRTSGKLHFSLRTMKPSTNTLITLHMDYEPGSILGAMLNRAGLATALDAGWKTTLENLSREILQDV